MAFTKQEAITAFNKWMDELINGVPTDSHWKFCHEYLEGPLPDCDVCSISEMSKDHMTCMDYVLAIATKELPVEAEKLAFAEFIATWMEK